MNELAIFRLWEGLNSKLINNTAKGISVVKRDQVGKSLFI